MVLLLFQNRSRVGGQYLSWKFLKKTHDQTQNVLTGKQCCSISWELQIRYVLFVPVHKVYRSDRLWQDTRVSNHHLFSLRTETAEHHRKDAQPPVPIHKAGRDH